VLAAQPLKHWPRSKGITEVEIGEVLDHYDALSTLLVSILCNIPLITCTFLL
jgi:hypothetical protein